MQTTKPGKYCCLDFFHIWFIDDENLCFVFIFKEKTSRFLHLILFISLTLK